MTHLALFASAFFTVFLLGFQQKNVHGDHYFAAIITSFGIGTAQILLWRLIPEADAGQIAATLIGGPTAATSCGYLRCARRSYWNDLPTPARD